MTEITGTPEHDEHAESLRMIRDSVAALVPPGGGLQRIRALRFDRIGYDPAVYRRMGDFGWMGLLVPEDKGGIGLGMRELCALCEELGAGLVPEPLVPATISAALIAEGGHQDLLADVVAGRRVLPTAWQEAPDTLEAPGRAESVRVFVPFAGGADGFLVPVRHDGRLGLFLWKADAIELSILPTQDGGHYGTVAGSFAEGSPLREDVGAALELALDRAALATSAYLLGLMEAAFAMTLNYLKSRNQFGRPIGSFQALQHRAADLKIQVALTRASVENAAAALDAGASGAERALAVSRAKARAADASLVVTRQAIQLHGGIGYTDEYDVGLYLRKAMVLANQYGSARLHRQRFMAVSSEGDDE